MFFIITFSLIPNCLTPYGGLLALCKANFLVRDVYVSAVSIKLKKKMIIKLCDNVKLPTLRLSLNAKG